MGRWSLNMPILHVMTSMAESAVSRSRTQQSILRGVADDGVLSLILLTRIIQRHWLADAVNRVRVEITPDILVHVVAGFVFSRAAAGLDRAVGSSIVATDIEVGYQPAGVAVRRLDLVDVDDRAELVHPEQFPASAVVIGDPAAIKDV